eukprot:scaffold266_cov391-Prasinococcus_capsulatus_cf.AAC.28
MLLGNSSHHGAGADVRLARYELGVWSGQAPMWERMRAEVGRPSSSGRGTRSQPSHSCGAAMPGLATSRPSRARPRQPRASPGSAGPGRMMARRGRRWPLTTDRQQPQQQRQQQRRLRFWPAAPALGLVRADPSGGKP